MAFNMDLPQMENISPWAPTPIQYLQQLRWTQYQLQYLQQLKSLAPIQYLQQLNYQQILLVYNLSSGGNPFLSSSYDDTPDIKRQRLECTKFVQDIGTPLTSKAAGGIAPPTPSSCFSGSCDDGQEQRAAKGCFHELLKSPKLKTEEPQFESPLKVGDVQPSHIPEILDLSFKPSRCEGSGPMVMLPSLSYEMIMQHPKHTNNQAENRYSVISSVQTKATIVSDLSDNAQSGKILQKLHLNYKPDAINSQCQNTQKHENYKPIQQVHNNRKPDVMPIQYQNKPQENSNSNCTPDVMSIQYQNKPDNINQMPMTKESSLSISPATSGFSLEVPSRDNSSTFTIAGGSETGITTTSAKLLTRSVKASIQCKICHIYYNTYYKLKQHMYTHTGEIPFVCDICGKGFLYRSHLTAHLQVHSDVKQFSCTDGCGRSFSQPSDRLIHVITKVCTRRARLLKPIDGGGWQCTQCGKQMKEQGHAEHHARTHETGVPLICSECGVNFQGLHPNTLVKHMRDNHSEYLKRKGL